MLGIAAAIGCSDTTTPTQDAAPTPDVVIDTGADVATNDVARDATDDVARDATSDVTNDATADVAADVARDVVTDAAVDVAMDAAADVAIDVARDSAMDVVDAAADAGADVRVDVVTDTGVVDVATDAGADVATVASCAHAPNAALRLGGGQWATVPDAASLHLSDVTAEAWVSFRGFTAGYSTIVAKPYGAGTADSFAIWYQGGGLFAGANPTSASDAIGGAWAPTIGRWYHVAFTYEHTTRVQRLYIDGVQFATGPASTDPAYDTHPFVIGADIEAGTPNGAFNGDIDEVRLWNTVRTADAIAQDRLQCSASVFTGLVGYWSLDEGNGQLLHDLSGNANHGTLGTTSSAEATDPAWISTASPDAASCARSAQPALRFASAQWVTVPDAASLHLSDVTAEAWVSFRGFTAGYSTIVAKPYGAGSADSFAIWHQGGSLFAGANPTSASDAIGGAWAPTLGRWYHLAFTYEHGSRVQRLYIDGVQFATGPASTDPAYDTHPFVIGADIEAGTPNGAFNGYIDEVRLWNTVRTADAIAADRFVCSAGSVTGLVGYWPLNEGSGQVAHDLSGGANNGTLGTTSAAEASDPTWVPAGAAF